MLIHYLSALPQSRVIQQQLGQDLNTLQSAHLADQLQDLALIITALISHSTLPSNIVPGLSYCAEVSTAITGVDLGFAERRG